MTRIPSGRRTRAASCVQADIDDDSRQVHHNHSCQNDDHMISTTVEHFRCACGRNSVTQMYNSMVGPGSQCQRWWAGSASRCPTHSQSASPRQGATVDSPVLGQRSGSSLSMRDTQRGPDCYHADVAFCLSIIVLHEWVLPSPSRLAVDWGYRGFVSPRFIVKSASDVYPGRSELPASLGSDRAELGAKDGSETLLPSALVMS